MANDHKMDCSTPLRRGGTASVATLLILTLLASVHAADFQAGMEAYNRGDFATALHEFRQLAEQGHAEAQVQLGAMYGDGEGVPEDDAEAVKWYHKAAEQGHSRGQLYLGMMYSLGTGVSRDDTEAVKWYRKAGEQGEAEALFKSWLYVRLR